MADIFRDVSSQLDRPIASGLKRGIVTEAGACVRVALPAIVFRKQEDGKQSGEGRGEGKPVRSTSLATSYLLTFPLPSKQNEKQGIKL